MLLKSFRFFLTSAFPSSSETKQQNNSVTEYILLGLTQDPERQKVVFVVFFIFYVGIVVGNSLIIVTIKSSRILGSPMYFFLFYLSLVDICFPTSMAPRVIVDALSAKKSISYNECMTHIFALHFFGSMEIFVLVLMVVDCYAAICQPLHYPTIMSRQVCIILIVLAWIGSFIHSMAQIMLALRMPFCGSNLIDHYCCDMQPLLKLACMDIHVMNLLVVFNSGALCTISFLILMISYFVILHSLQNHSAEGRKKALSTCTSHIIVVVLFLHPCIFLYTRPSATFPTDKMVAVFYTIGTPFLNPLIYTLRNAEVKNAMRKLWHVRITSESKR
ncbi:olfactory receptor 4C11-like [Hippopotamus amphibius kiboko]|uniref:olfactory receptor 4C11-like n=1 Tax=Hippopotamus amphibius kiboko TaxID=575201 RepID=UPI00259518C7|nr:olfactory receptor 4C11-like [Hippopotamus amphibius kiboko]